jgi:hypothetical protein
MRKLFLSIFYFFWNFRKSVKYKGFETKLESALINKQAHQVHLMRTIKKEIDNLWPKTHSKFIPLSLPQRREIKAKIEDQFRSQMLLYKVKINDNLQFV